MKELKESSISLNGLVATDFNKSHMTRPSIFQRPVWVIVFALTAAIAWGWAFPLIKVGFTKYALAGGLAALGIYIINKGRN